MVYLIWKVHPKNYNISKRPKIQKCKIYFPITFIFQIGITNWPTLACLCPCETLDWAKHSNQSLIFLKLDFTKVYDKVGWEFLFETLKKMNMAMDFIIIIRLLFKDT